VAVVRQTLTVVIAYLIRLLQLVAVKVVLIPRLLAMAVLEGVRTRLIKALALRGKAMTVAVETQTDLAVAVGLVRWVVITSPQVAVLAVSEYLLL
jgi:hypothetical protein